METVNCSDCGATFDCASFAAALVELGDHDCPDADAGGDA